MGAPKYNLIIYHSYTVNVFDDLRFPSQSKVCPMKNDVKNQQKFKLHDDTIKVESTLIIDKFMRWILS